MNTDVHTVHTRQCSPKHYSINFKRPCDFLRLHKKKKENGRVFFFLVFLRKEKTVYHHTIYIICLS